MQKIIRYSNRKLYSTNLSQYVTLSDIHSMVKSGTQVQVTDKATRADITEKTLSQVFAANNKLSSEELVKLIQG